MLTDEDLIADLSRLRERGADLEYTGDVPLTRRSVAATIAPVAAVAAASTLVAVAVTGQHTGAATISSPASTGSPRATVDRGGDRGPAQHALALVRARIVLAGKAIVYLHNPGQDPFGDSWSVAVEFGPTLPDGATRFDLGGGEVAWVADSPDGSPGKSVLVVQAGPQHLFYGAPSSFNRDQLEDFVRTQLHGQ
jgi:hypothetical protein